MTQSYAVNSTGQVIASPRSVYNLKELQERKSELFKSTAFFQKEFQAAELITEPDTFNALVQPFYVEEYLFFFAKQQLSASDPVVRESFQARNDSYYRYRNEKQKDLFNSIFCSQDGVKTLWWTLQAGLIRFERNVYDGRYIDISYVPPTYYTAFIRKLDEMRAKNMTEAREQHKAIMYISSREGEQKHIKKPETLLRSAVAFTDEQAFNDNAEKAVKEVLRKSSIIKRCKHSNTATRCLCDIYGNPYSGNIYNFYKGFRYFMKKNVPDVSRLRYAGKALFFNVGDNTHEIYICGTEEKPKFIIGGNSYNSYDALKQALMNKQAFVKRDWFYDVVYDSLPHD